MKDPALHCHWFGLKFDIVCLDMIESGSWACCSTKYLKQYEVTDYVTEDLSIIKNVEIFYFYGWYYYAEGQETKTSLLFELRSLRELCVLWQPRFDNAKESKRGITRFNESIREADPRVSTPNVTVKKMSRVQRRCLTDDYANEH